MEISSFMALVYPLDLFTWIFSLLSTIVMFLILIIMQKLWSHESGEAYLPEYLYQGKKLHYYILQNVNVSFTFRFLSFNSLDR